MKNKFKKDNTLLKRNNLLFALKKRGIKRVSPTSLFILEDILEKNLLKAINLLKEEMIINGRKTLKKEDIKSVFEKKKPNFWEI